MSSVREQSLIDLSKTLLPTNFVAKETDDKLLAYLNMALADVNLYTPATAYTLDNMPDSWTYIVIFGGTLFANLFLMLNYSLKDFSYSDYGLTLNIDRHGKLSSVHEKQVAAYSRMCWNAKKYEAMQLQPAGLGQPRFQSQIGQFLKVCIAGSTLIRLADNTIETIESLYNQNRKDFLVYSIDDKKNIVTRKAEYVAFNGVSDTLKISLNTGDILECTPEHLILTNNTGYIEAKQLKIGQPLVSATGERFITSIEKGDKCPVYDIVNVDKYNNFALASGIFVHNCFGTTFPSSNFH